ncbi:MAG: hypothetical protein IJ225_08670 [Solobacterium sp.]|nr:hypothetical protein [Solobacterium sp.]
MSWYKADKDVLRQIIETVAAEEQKSVQMVEKDMIQSVFLMNISNSSLPLVFKGALHFLKRMI